MRDHDISIKMFKMKSTISSVDKYMKQLELEGGKPV